ncbi:MAG: hypothetical protein COB26_12305 [Piscirickettsiaceae bacterium]|nr:MAG: hypothetical protein COB26_12305 [Piscirickettsiaceae bacterium]
MNVTLKLNKSVTSIPELSRAIDAFEAIDEIYRLMKSGNSINPDSKIDFRKKPFKDIKGGELEKFNVTSPPEITVNADNLWIAALLYILKDYSNTKKNIIEASKDSKYLATILKNIGEEEYLKASISAKLFAGRISEISENNKKWLIKKLESAERILHKDNIMTISTDGEENESSEKSNSTEGEQDESHNK